LGVGQRERCRRLAYEAAVEGEPPVARGGECRKLGGTDVDGAAAGEYCLQLCQAASDCRSGYACCQAQEYPEGDAEVCAPPSFCRDQ